MGSATKVVLYVVIGLLVLVFGFRLLGFVLALTFKLAFVALLIVLVMMAISRLVRRI